MTETVLQTRSFKMTDQTDLSGIFQKGDTITIRGTRGSTDRVVTGLKVLGDARGGLLIEWTDGRSAVIHAQGGNVARMVGTRYIKLLSEATVDLP